VLFKGAFLRNAADALSSKSQTVRFVESNLQVTF